MMADDEAALPDSLHIDCAYVIGWSDGGIDRTKNTVFSKYKEKGKRKLFLPDWNEPQILLQHLHAIKCPSLIINGDNDLIRPEHTLLIFQNIPHAYLWILPHSGHGTYSNM